MTAPPHTGMVRFSSRRQRFSSNCALNSQSCAPACSAPLRWFPLSASTSPTYRWRTARSASKHPRQWHFLLRDPSFGCIAVVPLTASTQPHVQVARTAHLASTCPNQLLEHAPKGKCGHVAARKLLVEIYQARANAGLFVQDGGGGVSDGRTAGPQNLVQLTGCIMQVVLAATSGKDLIERVLRL